MGWRPAEELVKRNFQEGMVLVKKAWRRFIQGRIGEVFHPLKKKITMIMVTMVRIGGEAKEERVGMAAMNMRGKTGESKVLEQNVSLLLTVFRRKLIFTVFFAEGRKWIE